MIDIYQKKEQTRSLRQTSNLLGFAGILFCILNLIISFILAIAITLLKDYIGDFAAKLLQNEVSIAVSTLFIVPIPFLIFLKCNGGKVSDTIPFSKPNGKVAAVIIPLILIAMSGVTSAIMFLATILKAFGINVLDKGSTQGLTPTGGIETGLIYILVISILTGLLEEFCFRGIVMHSLRRFGDTFAIFASAFIFGIMHRSFVQGLNAFCFGVFMGYAVIITKSIWTSVILHMINNLIATLSVVLPSGPYLMTTLIYSAISLAAGITAFIIFLFYVKSYKKDNIKFYKNDAISNPKKFIVYLTAPVMIIFYICLINLNYISDFILKILRALIR
jgi:membrane protease YdiL (CAAX protease family)